MDKELSKEHIRKVKIKKTVKYLVILVAFVMIFIIFKKIINPSIQRSRIQTAIASVGAIEGTITASGIVVPEFEQVLTSPFTSSIDSVYHKAGDKIELGEPILKLNNEFTLIDYKKLQDEYKLKINRKNQLSLNMERMLIDLQAEYEIMHLRIEALEAQVKAQEHIYEFGGGAKVNLDQAILNLKIARLEQIQQGKKITNQEKSLVADLMELDLNITIHENNILELEKRLELAEAKSVRNGVITWVKDNIGENVNQGEIIARIADLEKFKVESKISDIHAPKLIVGNPVKVRINDIDLLGLISNIKPTIENGIINFIVELDDKTNEHLRSNLRVDVFVITSSKNDIIRLENGPFINGSGRQDIFVVSGDDAYLRTVVIGETNFDWVEVEKGLEPGEEVIITNMEDHIHQTKVKIKK
ncbi:MAG: efflux RND transporter periplasmic adaptor subunit [Candidatus Cloacimonetes bacterium]|nr:efflux RND transporter periplasmic adaptor subunit [Candidatus Cloacimonadota bacterium]